MLHGHPSAIYQKSLRAMHFIRGEEIDGQSERLVAFHLPERCGDAPEPSKYCRQNDNVGCVSPPENPVHTHTHAENHTLADEVTGFADGQDHRSKIGDGGGGEFKGSNRFGDG